MSRVCVLLELETNDRRLIEPDNSTVRAVSSVRRAVELLFKRPQTLARVVFVTTPEMAELICRAHDAMMQEAFGETMAFPPADYVPPTRD